MTAGKHAGAHTSAWWQTVRTSRETHGGPELFVPFPILPRSSTSRPNNEDGTWRFRGVRPCAQNFTHLVATCAWCTGRPPRKVGQKKGPKGGKAQLTKNCRGPPGTNGASALPDLCRKGGLSAPVRHWGTYPDHRDSALQDQREKWRGPTAVTRQSPA